MNTLYYGDNLPILREYIKDECVDLIYLDPPFNSNRSYNVLFKDESGKDSESQITAFDDTWHWGESAEAVYDELVTGRNQAVANMINAMRQFIGTNQMMAYLVMMAARLVELHRVLKPTGSLYLHCDPTASHYLKILLDTVFSGKSFRNEIDWQRSHTRSTISKVYRRAHDVILFYTKSEEYTFNMQFRELSETSKRLYENSDEKGAYQAVPLLVSGKRNGETGTLWRGIDPNKRGKEGMHWVTRPVNLEEYDKKGLILWPQKLDGVPRLKYYLKDSPGVPMNDFWDDISLISSSSSESLGYPTQKPIVLLERIIQASSNPGDVVLDPFSGCGTAITAAQKLGRQWIGIDITHLAIAMHKSRLKDTFGLEPNRDYHVIGEPESLSGAQQLAYDDRFQFQWWALSLVEARPLGGGVSKQGKKGADQGIDGIIPFLEEGKKLNRALVQVKSGHVNSGDIRNLRGVLEREKDAPIGVFVTLEPPTRPMIEEAASAGFYSSPLWQRKYPRIQILTIEQLLNGEEIKMPSTSLHAFKQAQPNQGQEGSQGEFTF